ncbi:hypothetical protein S7335_2356 [Synechococcus sp. PCC 7335]|nr:hypothetical protein S7335_2356 [Synechococcus sp. PCC 7335]
MRRCSSFFSSTFLSYGIHRRDRPAVITQNKAFTARYSSKGLDNLKLGMI